MKIAAKEADETEPWLQLCEKINLPTPNEKLNKDLPIINFIFYQK